ncbi:MAG: flagellar basal body-associated FliL family protein [Paracoccaceae bacterium]
MSDATAEVEESSPKKSKKPMIIGLVLMLVLGGGGFFAVYTGMILGHGSGLDDPHAQTVTPGAMPDIGFIPIEPLTISLGPTAKGRFLRFTSQLEVEKAYLEETATLLPRVIDVMNGYLRAVDMSELEDPTAMVRLRAQILRRIQIVTGEGRVRDLLITEFIIN